MSEYQSADRIQDDDGRQYHIGLAPGEIAPWIVTCGDAGRARRVAERFDTREPEITNREFVTITGTLKGLPISAMGTGMGCDNTEIAVVELCQIVENPCVVRVGTSGALQEDIALGDLVISTGSVRLENTSTWFVPEGFPAIAHHEVIAALVAAATAHGWPFHTGLTATGSGFYGAQGRKGLGFEPLVPDISEQMGKLGVKNFEMETSTLFTLATLRGFRAGAVCAAIANRPKGTFITKAEKSAAEDAAIDVALTAITSLAN